MVAAMQLLERDLTLVLDFEEGQKKKNRKGLPSFSCECGLSKAFLLNVARICYEY